MMGWRFTTPPALQPAKGVQLLDTLVDEGGGVLPYPWAKGVAFDDTLACAGGLRLTDSN